MVLKERLQKGSVKIKKKKKEPMPKESIKFPPPPGGPILNDYLRYGVEFDKSDFSGDPLLNRPSMPEYEGKVDSEHKTRAQSYLKSKSR